MYFDPKRDGYILEPEEVEDLNRKMAQIRDMCEVLRWQWMLGAPDLYKKRKLN